MAKFLRRTWNRYSKLGKGKKKKHVWRKPKGRDNKMREKRKGYPAVVSIGYKKGEKRKGKTQDKKPRLIRNIKDLEGIKKSEIIILGNIGKKKKIEIVKKAKKENIQIQNINAKKFLGQIKKEHEKKEKQKVENKKTKEKKKERIKEKPKQDKKDKEKEKWT